MAFPDLPAFARLLGVNLLRRSPERTEADLPVRAELCNRRGVLHGGAVMALYQFPLIRTRAPIGAVRWT